jgi:hypothetical protein
LRPCSIYCVMLHFYCTPVARTTLLRTLSRSRTRQSSGPRHAYDRRSRSLATSATKTGGLAPCGFRSEGADMLMAVASGLHPSAFILPSPPTLTLPHEGGREFTFLSVGAGGLFVGVRGRATGAASPRPLRMLILVPLSLARTRPLTLGRVRRTSGRLGSPGCSDRARLAWMVKGEPCSVRGRVQFAAVFPVRR